MGRAGALLEKLRNGIPGHDTIRRVFELFEPKEGEGRFAVGLRDAEYAKIFIDDVEARLQQNATPRREG